MTERREGRGREKMSKPYSRRSTEVKMMVPFAVMIDRGQQEVEGGRIRFKLDFSLQIVLTRAIVINL